VQVSEFIAFLSSLIPLSACDLLCQGARPYAAAWYKKTDVTFSDVIGAVRGPLVDYNIYRQCPPDPDIPKIQKERLKCMTQRFASLHNAQSRA